MTKKIFRTDLLIEWLRKALYDKLLPCPWCPIENECHQKVFNGGELLCIDEQAEDFKQEIIDGFSTDVEVVEDEAN